jgi:hypothetical protein
MPRDGCSHRTPEHARRAAESARPDDGPPAPPCARGASLRRRFHDLEEPLGELRDLAAVIDALSSATLEAGTGTHTTHRAHEYLGRRLRDAVEALAARSERAPGSRR